MKCKKCGAEVDENAEFCSGCGAKIAKGKIICPYCNAEISDGKFCSNCGRPLDGSDAGKEHSENKASDSTERDMLTGMNDFGISESDSPGKPGNDPDFSAKMEMLSKKRMAEKDEYEKADALSKVLADFKYITQSNGNIVITGLANNYIIEAVIPEGVVSIADDAFKDCELVTVNLPKSIIKIGDRAFMGCKDLSSINFPEKLTLIGDEAFADCSFLDIEFPKTIRKIGKDALKGTAAYNRQVKEKEESKRKAEEEQRKAREEHWRSIGVGSTVEFGNYHGATKWTVLAKSDNKALIIANDIVDSRPYNKQDARITWEECTLRKWLNDGYINEAFSEEERNRILTTHVVNNDNPDYDTEGGNDTEDKVFLLSTSEVETYFSDYEKRRKAKGTKYAKGNGLWVDTDTGSTCGYSEWWLRSPGSDSDQAAYVDYDGDFDGDGGDVDDSSCGVRPALYICKQ